MIEMNLLNDEKLYKFFNPLCCSNRQIYYEAILELIEKSKTVSVLYENDARDCLILYLRNCIYDVKDDTVSEDVHVNISSKKTETENASAILRYFRECNWIEKREIARNGENTASVTLYCSKFMNAIEKIFHNDTEGELTNHIFAIYDILHSAFDVNHARNIRPYINILTPLTDHIANLKNEFLSLQNSIHIIMQSVIKLTEISHFGDYLCKDDFVQKFFNDYFFIKKDGLIPGYISEIESMLNRLSNSEMVLKMSEEYCHLKQTDMNTAVSVVQGQLSEIKTFISYDYNKRMEYIDKKINSYYQLYTTRIILLLNNGTNLKSSINQLLTFIKNMESSKKVAVLESISRHFQIESFRYIGKNSIERRKKRNTNTKSSAIVCSSLSDEEKRNLTEESLSVNNDRYQLSRVAAYLNQLLGNDLNLKISQDTVKCKDDAMMLVSSVIYSHTENFPYEVEFTDEKIINSIVSMRQFIIKRRTL